MGKSSDLNADNVAKVLLDFHANLIWVDGLGLGQSSPGKRKRGERMHAKAGRKRIRQENPASIPTETHQESTQAVREFLSSSHTTESTIGRSRASNTDSHARQGLEINWASSDSAQEEQASEINGQAFRNEPQARFNTLVLAACSENPDQERTTGMGMTPAPVEEALLDLPALDFVGPHSVSGHGNVLDVMDLDFVTPLLGLNNPNVVNSQSPMYPNPYSFQQSMPPAQNQD